MNNYFNTISFTDKKNEFEEFISNKLPPVVRLSPLYFILILICIFSICWFIKFPEIISANVKVTNIITFKDSGYFADMYIPAHNFSKIKSYQNVLLMFYSDTEENYIPCKIISILNATNDSAHLRVMVQESLSPNEKAKFQAQKNLLIKVKIIFQNKRLLERLYGQF